MPPTARSASPLRYPGGKQILSRVLAELIRRNDCHGGTYIEAYAGGAGAALNLLFDEHVDRIIINDADYRVAAFWLAVLKQTDAFLDLVTSAPLTVAEWRRQRRIYAEGRKTSRLRLGFATFYLNRCNRSGIISSGGPIGGLRQRGKWKINARFNRSDLVGRLTRVSSYRERIEVTNLDALDFLGTVSAGVPSRERPFGFLDPPYFTKAQDLYMNHYRLPEHQAVAAFVKERLTFPWVMSYDNVPEIRRLYGGLRTVPLGLDYSARERRRGSEMLIFKPGLAFPPNWREGIPSDWLSSSRRR